MKQKPNQAGIHAVRPNDDDDEADDMTGEPDDDAVETEDARQDPQDGALNAGQRRQSSDDVMRRERSDPNTENASKRRG